MRIALNRTVLSVLALASSTLCAPPATAQPAQLDAWKQQLAQDIRSREKFTANMVDQIFSFGELGFQEFETSAYLVGLLRANGISTKR